jgi:tripartite-type tricarboxylate transporter receptor subunit TctC
MLQYPSRFLAATSVALACTLGASAPAQAEYPDKPVKFVVNFTAGGPLDIMARVLGEKLSAQFKQPFVVENKTGSGGNIGAASVANAAPDGYTLLVGLDSTFTVNPGLYPNLGFKPEQLKPVTLFGSSNMLIAVSPKLQVSTLKDLVAKGRTDPVSFSSAGNGSPGHLSGAMLSQATGLKITHVPYRGNAPAVLALVSGEVQAAALAASGLIQQVQAGTVTALAVTGRARSPLLPNVPTTAELGYADVRQDVIYTVMAPSGTPQAIIDKLEGAITTALVAPDVQERLRTMDISPMNLRGDAATRELSATRDRYLKIIKSSGMSVD